MDLQILKTQSSLVQLANDYLALNLTNQKWQKCPCCGGENKFGVREHSYVCMRTSCDLHTPGDIFTLFAWKGYSIPQTIQILNNNNVDTPLLNKSNTKLNKLFIDLVKEYESSNIAKNYIRERYNLQELKSNIDYIGFSDNTLSKLGIYGQRIVFPIRNSYGDIIHFHTRSINPEDELRWLPTKTEEGQLSFANYIWNYCNNKYSTDIYLTEGISDGLSVAALGLDTISILSLYGDFLPLLKSLVNVRRLTLLFDNDKVPINSKGLYKSWDNVIPEFIKLKLYKPELDIRCCHIPNRIGIKDVNEWINKSNIKTKLQFEHQVNKTSVSLEAFFINNYWNTPGMGQLDLLKLSLDDKYKSILEYKIKSSYSSWIDYIKYING